MTLTFPLICLLLGFFLFFGIILTKSSHRLGVPSLVIYLALGIFLGNGGPFDFIYDYPEFTHSFSNLALAIILFIGGLETDFRHIKPVLGRGLVLSTVGVLLTAGSVALFLHVAFGIRYLEGFLIGSVLSSTDAAAVFSILNSKGLRLKENISQTLELESGTNDPMAFFLTTMFTSMLHEPEIHIGPWLWLFVKEMSIGFLAGGALGLATSLILQRLQLVNRGMYPVLILATILIGIGALMMWHGNVLLGMYVTGMVISSHREKWLGRKETYLFFESISWLMEISLFVLLGLQVFPRNMVAYLPQALIVCLFLILIARPLSVFVSLAPFKASLQKKVFVSWVGLRGATPIVFSLIPLIARVRVADVIFNIVFAVVLISVLLQGTTLGWLANKLGLNEDQPASSQM